MLNQQLISSHIESLNSSQTVKEALQMMNDLGCDQLAVVSEGMYEGLIQEEDILDEVEDQTLDKFKYELLPYAVQANDHFLTAARLNAERKLKIIPVVSPQKEYLGSITESELLQQFERLQNVRQGGALLVLSMDATDYSTGQLAKLVETNDAVITQLNTFPDEVSGKLIVTVRINKEEVSDIVSTFQRYDYQVIFHAGQEQYENELRRNYFHLMNFLEM